MASIKVYYSSVTGSRQVRQRQAAVRRILDVNRLQYELIDVSAGEGRLREMRDKAGDPQAVPPQIFNGDEYCGDFEMLYQATENEEVSKFLKMTSIDKPAREEITV
ncbi:SH3 domain-binding glutamic acid-rich-like protein 3 [Struthio camelus]|uniref:SH3 domain-binding glutamic acid-rich-like protein 3 n=1 Tax=Struthio camelus TaxID=8801 RepID=UPI0036041551